MIRKFQRGERQTQPNTFFLSIRFTEDEKQRVLDLAAALGTNGAELLRRALDYYCEKHAKAKTALTKLEKQS